jgi:transmembrane sensor
MTSDRLQYLLERYHQDQCTEAELDELNEWFHSWNPGTGNMQQWLQESGGAQSLQQAMYADFSAKMKKPHPLKTVGWLYKVAAASIILTVLVFLLYPDRKQPAPAAFKENTATGNTGAIHDVPPGTDKAMLKLADGTEIALSDTGIGHIAMQNNTEIKQAGKGTIAYTAGEKPGQQVIYNSLTTPRGGKFSLTLADGTAVTLDAASSITYPVAFTGKERLVKITGQVYFEVVHDAEHPFKVITKNQVIEDIGTAFNVNAYDDDLLTKITLEEGSINVRNATQSALLVPGQQAIIKNGQSQIQVKKVNVEEVVAWKKGWFIFHQEDLPSIMKQAARWYNVEIVYEGTPVDKKFGGHISRYKNISELLENLKISGGIRYSIDSNKVVLKN